jgi:tRNA dimethylallyltransferase
MDVGSAKPTLSERNSVRHYGLDLVSVSKRYDVSKYVNYAKDVVKRVYQNNGRLLIVGGSGFYLRSFFSQVVDQVIVSDEIRDFVDSLNEKKGLNGLLAELEKLNPDGLGSLDKSNPVRVIKSLERCLASGSTIQKLQKEFMEKPTPFCDFEKKTCLLDRSNTSLFGLIEKRTRRMLELGLVEETGKLIEQGILNNHPASNAVGYREAISYLNGEIRESELASAIDQSTRQLVAKQRKWFRKYYFADQKLMGENVRAFSSRKLIW